MSEFFSPEVTRICRRIRRIFARLDSLLYLGEEERREFRYYEETFGEALLSIDRKIRAGSLTPIDLAGFPRILRYPGYAARIGVFIGSFDPFQMTHLAAALRFLASDEAAADFVIVVPEGGENPLKPRKSDYRFRYELLRLQLEGIFEPFVVPLDIGAGTDTIGIVSRLIGLHPGGRLELTHLLGSDALPTAARLLPDDLEAWRAAAARSGVDFDHGVFAILRDPSETMEGCAAAIRSLGSRFAADRSPIGAPSSSDFRSRRVITVAFPTEAVLSRLELLFRYGMNRPWLDAAAPGGIPAAWAAAFPGGAPAAPAADRPPAEAPPAGGPEYEI